LKPEVVVAASYGMVMLVDDKMVTMRMRIALVKVHVV
jgi:hypothetical protein